MGTFIVFILKSTCCLAVFYLFYRLLLSRDTFHRFNRMALLGVIAFSIAIPFVRMVADEPAGAQPAMPDAGQLLQMPGMSVPETADGGDLSSWLAALLAVYACGCLFFAGRFLYSISQIVRLIRSGEMAGLEGGMRLVVVEQTVPPFSWMKYIVVSRIDMEENGAEILAHEQAHVRACHSLDMWLAGCCVILHWFNPAAWLLKQELQNVHEYEADENVIAHGVDARHYQLLLIKKAVGMQRFTSMANSFGHGKLKKRITMMLKQKSNPWSRLKYLYVLPLTAVTLAAFARPDISRGLEKIAEAQLAEPFASGQEAREDAKQARKDRRKVEMAVSKEPCEDVSVVGYGSMKQQDRKVFDIVKRDTLFRSTLDFKSNMKSVRGVRYVQPAPLVVLDGVEYTGGIDKINANEIESISILKDKGAVELYGEKAAGGVILITTKKSSFKAK